MATETIVVRTCDVTGTKDESVRNVSLPIPLVDTDENGNVDYSNGVTYKQVTLKLDAADKVMADVLGNIAAAVRPLFTENTTVKVKGEPRTKSDTEDDSDAPESEIGTAEHMREWARRNGYKVGEKGRIAKAVSEAYWAVPEHNLTPETDEDDSDDEE